MQTAYERIDSLLFSFEKDFHACISAVPHVACQAFLGGCAVDEWAETDALHDASNVNLNTQADTQRYCRRERIDIDFDRGKLKLTIEPRCRCLLSCLLGWFSRCHQIRMTPRS